MRTGHAGRLWIIVGAMVAVVLVVGGWFALINPQHRTTDRLRDQTADAEVKVASLRHRLVELRQQSSRLAQYQAALATARAALPSSARLTDVLREVQAAGDLTSVSVSGVAFGSPGTVTVAGAQVYVLPVTLTASSAAANLDRFLNQLQQVQPRAALIISANTTATGQGILAGSAEMAISMKVFVTSSPTK